MSTQPVAATTGMADAAIQFALAQVGKPYVWGSVGPNSYDCSGLIIASYKHAGYKFPIVRPWTGTLITYGVDVPRANLQPGDLIFPDPGHVQMYIGNGKIVEAPRPGLKVRVVPIWGFWRARRLVTPGSAYASNVSASNPVSSVVNPLAALDKAFDAITNPHLWFRIGIALMGIIAMVVAVTGKQAPINAVSKVVGK